MEKIKELKDKVMCVCVCVCVCVYVYIVTTALRSYWLLSVVDNYKT